MALTNIPSTMFSGRKVLRTDLADKPSAEAIRKDLERVLPQHAYNKQQIRVLQEYHKGYHPAIQERTKLTRTDVDNKITVNYPWSMTRDIVGYFLGKPIQMTQRQGKYRAQMEAFIAALRAENKPLVDYQIAQDCSICGVGYRGIFTDAVAKNGTHLKLLRLDPINTFIVYSSDPTKGAIYAGTSYENANDTSRVTYYNIYTSNKMYVFKDEVISGQDPVAGNGGLKLIQSKDMSFGGGLPIVEYKNNMWRLGDWETATSLIDAIDFTASDGVNDIQQAVNSILIAMGMDLDAATFADLSVNGFLNVKDIPAGVTPVVQFISQAMDASVGIAMRDYLEATLRVIVGVPDRKTRGGGGGDTGDAVFMRDGWQDIDLVASSKEPYFVQAEREALGIMLYILDTYKEVAKIKATDVDIHFNRNKTANAQSSAQVYQMLTSGEASLAPEDALDIANLTNNVHDVIMRMNMYHKERELNDSSDTNGVSDSDEDNTMNVGEDDTTPA